MNAEQLVEYWQSQKPIRSGKTLWLAIGTCIHKQVPIKPTHNKMGWHCPTCKKEIYWDTDYGQQKFNYCTECGQKLDWG